MRTVGKQGAEIGQLARGVGQALGPAQGFLQQGGHSPRDFARRSLTRGQGQPDGCGHNPPAGVDQLIQGQGQKAGQFPRGRDRG